MTRWSLNNMKSPSEFAAPGIHARKRLFGAWLVVFMLTMPFASFAAEVLDPANPAKGARTWRWAGDGVSLRLTQILPDQVRGFYQARGFRAAEAEVIARACVFQTVMKNESSAVPVDIDLARWRIAVDGEEKPLKLEQQWQQQWERLDVPQPARLAFRWALFPTVQSFAQGDWNMGMTLFTLPQAAVFDLHVNWRAGDKNQTATVRAIACAPDTSKASR